MTHEEFIEHSKKNRPFSEKTKWNKDGSVITNEGFLMIAKPCQCDYRGCLGWQWGSLKGEEDQNGFTNFMVFLDKLNRSQEYLNESRPQMIIKSFEGSFGDGPICGNGSSE